jgi:hypothetical protein
MHAKHAKMAMPMSGHRAYNKQNDSKTTTVK